MAALSGESSLGALQSAGLLSSLVDEVITGFHEVAEHLERQIDTLDQVALGGDSGGTFLHELVQLRQRISFLRRTLAPHRDALAALARPELATDAGVGQPWPGLLERLETASRSVDGLRDALLGTYDIHMGRAAQRANDVMKALTVVSSVFLPALVLAGIMGMNFEDPRGSTRRTTSTSWLAPWPSSAPCSPSSLDRGRELSGRRAEHRLPGHDLHVTASRSATP